MLHYSSSKMFLPTSIVPTNPIVVGLTIRCQNPGFRPPSSTVSRLPHKVKAPVKASLSQNVMTTTDSTSMSPLTGHDQIGIVSFLLRKNYFVTGATGLLAKILVEKMLRTVPDVGKIYLLIKAKDKEAATKRLKTEIIESEVFKYLKQKHGNSYEEFMTRKLIPVVGDVSKPDLGMDAESTAHLAKEIDVIVNSAGSTTFDERYDVALNTNTRGPVRLMSFAKKCKRLCVFLHISTAFVNGEREGVVAEKPFLMGQSIAQEKLGTSVDRLDLDAEFRLASTVLNSVTEKEANRTMKELGFERARRYGWQNSYVFSKAMGEMAIDEARGDIPVVIVRPSVVESTYREPFPGWIQGNRMLDPLILSYGKGQLPAFCGDPNARLDLVPADMVMNATIAAMAKHGIAAKPELNVYHVGSSVVNPFYVHDAFKLSHDYFASSPLLDNKGDQITISDMKFYSSADKFASYISKEIVEQSRLSGLDPNARRKVEKLWKKKTDLIVHMAKVYEPFLSYKGWFGNENTQKLLEEMSMEELWDFGFDVRTVNWRHYLMNIHIPGLKRHVLMMKEV